MMWLLSVQELLAIASNRMVRMDLTKGDTLKTWRFQNMKTWSVNWDIKQVNVRCSIYNLLINYILTEILV